MSRIHVAQSDRHVYRKYLNLRMIYQGSPPGGRSATSALTSFVSVIAQGVRIEFRRSVERNFVRKLTTSRFLADAVNMLLFVVTRHRHDARSRSA